MDSVLRLAWALPLVLITGAAMVLILKRFVIPMEAGTQRKARLVLHESLSVSDETRVYLIEADNQAYLVVESARHAVLQSAATTSATVRVPRRAGPWWVQRLYRAGVR